MYYLSWEWGDTNPPCACWWAGTLCTELSFSVFQRETDCVCLCNHVYVQLCVYTTIVYICNYMHIYIYNRVCPYILVNQHWQINTENSKDKKQVRVNHSCLKEPCVTYTHLHLRLVCVSFFLIFSPVAPGPNPSAPTFKTIWGCVAGPPDPHMAGTPGSFPCGGATWHSRAFPFSSPSPLTVAWTSTHKVSF